MTKTPSPFKILIPLVLLLLVACGSSGGLESSTSATAPETQSEVAAQEEIQSIAPLARTANLAVFKKVNDWGNGFTAEVTVTNTTGQTIKDWQLSFQMPANITSVWNAAQIGREGNLHRLIGKSYNNSIAPGQKITLGFNASPGGTTVTATNLVFEWPDGTGGTSGTGTSGTGTSGTGTSGSGTSGTGTSGSGTSGTGTSGSGTSGTGTSGSGTSGTGTSGSGTSGTGTSGSGTSGTGTSGSGTSGTGTSGSGTSGTGTSGSGTSGGSTSPSPSGQVTYTISSNWGSGFGAQVEIRNPGSTATDNWTLDFTLPAKIDSLWNGKVLSRSGNIYKVGPETWNTSIPPGGAVSFGFNGSPGGSLANASNFVLSGQPVSPPPDPIPSPSPTTTPTPTPTPNPTPNPNPPAAGFFSTSGSKIVDSQGNTVYLNGINWFGMETETFSPHGLWTRSLDSMLDQMAALGYDTLRIPFSNQALRSTPVSIDYSKNPDLQGKSFLQLLDILVAKAGQRNMRIILDRHRPTKDGQSDLWYTSEVSEEQWISDWVTLALRYKGNPTVIGADLHNEPHGRATWGSGQTTTDWRLAAQRAGNRILAANPDWLIIVEGVESVNGNNYWWGGNLRNADTFPVTLTVPNKVVYSTHDYATSVYNQSWFSASNYPANLPGIWDANWGYLLKNNIAPVLVGEFGTKYTSTVDQVWLRELVKYIGDNGAHFTYWCWNPNSTDTGGILNDDWNTVNTTKQNVLNPLMQR